MRILNCFIIDDEKGPRERLAILLSKIDNIKIIGIEENPETAIQSIIQKKPDIVFVDVEMPRLNGFDVVKSVREALPHQDFVFVTGYNQYAIKAIKNEAFDFLVKPVDIDELKETVERYSKRLINKYNNNSNTATLELFTPRELEILCLIGRHKTANDIANELHLSKHTVDSHRKNILYKSNLNKTSELVVFARENGVC